MEFARKAQSAFNSATNDFRSIQVPPGPASQQNRHETEELAETVTNLQRHLKQLYSCLEGACALWLLAQLRLPCHHCHTYANFTIPLPQHVVHLITL